MIFNNINLQATPAKYYKKYGDWKSMFIKSPKINFGGYYILKEKYWHEGEAIIGCQVVYIFY